VPELLAVLPLAQDLGEVDGRRVQAICVEVWSDGVVVRWSAEPGPAEAAFGAGKWSVGDDVGTAYWRHAGGSHGNDGFMRNEADWRPAPPPEARHLEVTFHDGTEVRLRATLSLPPGRSLSS
jgi:hypothetical protein